MQITIKGVNLDVTEALDHHARKKLNKLSTHLSSITSIDIILKIDSHKKHIAEGTVLFPSHTIFAESDNGDMYNAIDKLAKKLLAQVDKYKDKITDHHPHHAKSKQDIELVEQQDD
jgi:putative sigma-54 modulation protein